MNPSSSCSVHVAAEAPQSVLSALLNDARDAARLRTIGEVSSLSIACVRRAPGDTAELLEKACAEMAAAMLNAADIPAWRLVMDVVHDDTRMTRRDGLWNLFLKHNSFVGGLGPEVAARLDGKVQCAGLVRLSREDIWPALRSLFAQKSRYQYFGGVFLARLSADLARETERLRALASPTGYGPVDSISLLREMLYRGGVLAHAAGDSDEPRREIHFYGPPRVISQLTAASQ
jgi:hypothetical protein